MVHGVMKRVHHYIVNAMEQVKFFFLFLEGME